MKRLLLSVLGMLALGMGGPAWAADMAVKAPPPAPPPPVYSWNGFYIGGNGGWAENHNCLDFIAAGVDFSDGCRDRSGGVIGGQLGYRWQFNQFVFGLEGQGDWADLSSSRASLINSLDTIRVKTDGIGLLTGQLGWAGWNSTTLFYVKGGAAVTGNRLDVFNAIGTDIASASATRWGATVGVGFEYSFTPNWSVGLEYDHLFMGHSNNSFSVANPIVAGAVNRIDQDVDMVTVRFNYRFNWGATPPVAARY
jgi:outer membrane immunogenic protein